MEFIQYSDGLVRIQGDQDDEYKVMIEDFVKDLQAVGVRYDVLLEDIDERRYMPGVGLLHFKNGSQIKVSDEWSEGEAILHHFTALKEQKARRQAEAAPTPPAEPSGTAQPMPTEWSIERALAYLKSTDWMAIREREAGIAMPSMIAETRKKAYALVPQNYQVSIPKTSLDAAQNNEEEHV